MPLKLNQMNLQERLLRVRLCERERKDGGSGGFCSASDCSARRKFPLQMRLDCDYRCGKDMAQKLISRKLQYLPNLSRTDGPAGGCVLICNCLLLSYLLGYEIGACDEDDANGACFEIFSASSWSSSSFGNAYLDTGASFLLNFNSSLINTKFNGLDKN